MPVCALGLLVHSEGHNIHQPVGGGTGGVRVDNVGQRDSHLLVAVIEELGDDEPVEEVAGVDHIAWHQAQHVPGA